MHSRDEWLQRQQRASMVIKQGRKALFRQAIHEVLFASAQVIIGERSSPHDLYTQEPQEHQSAIFYQPGKAISRDAPCEE